MVNIGDKFGRLTVIDLAVEYTPIKRFPGCNQKRHIAICQCDCGSPPIRVRIDGLIKSENSSRKPARSCGCLQRERVTKHGCWGHPLFVVWNRMMDRCYKPHDKKYLRYGARGITVCEDWHDPNNFITDMFEGYSKDLQIDRIDNDKGYYKENCRWVTRIQQARNKSSNVNVTFNGETHCLKEWSHITGLNYGTLVERIQVLGWPIEKALTQPARKGNYHWAKNQKT